MQFVREIYFLLDSERDNEKTPFESTPRGKVLKKKNSLGLLPIMKEFSPPMNENTGQEKPIKENHLLDSVIFLRNKIVAHFDDEYCRFKGSKVSISLWFLLILFIVFFLLVYAMSPVENKGVTFSSGM